jgi:hypothetical protein
MDLLRASGADLRLREVTRGCGVFGQGGGVLRDANRLDRAVETWRLQRMGHYASNLIGIQYRSVNQKWDGRCGSSVRK